MVQRRQGELALTLLRVILQYHRRSAGLTSLFGMGRGVCSPPQQPPYIHMNHLCNLYLFR